MNLCIKLQTRIPINMYRIGKEVKCNMHVDIGIKMCELAFYVGLVFIHCNIKLNFKLP